MFTQTNSPLSESICNVRPFDYYEYIDKLKSMNNFFDVKDRDNITPLFLCLQYSSINKLLLVLFDYICTYKHINCTSFNDFNKNMQLLKDNFPNYYEKLVIQIKELISNDEIVKKLII